MPAKRCNTPGIRKWDSSIPENEKKKKKRPNVSLVMCFCCCCCCCIPLLNTLGVTQYVKYILKKYNCTVTYTFHMVRGLSVWPLFWGHLFPFQEGGYCYARSLSWLNKRHFSCSLGFLAGVIQHTLPVSCHNISNSNSHHHFTTVLP